MAKKSETERSDVNAVLKEEYNKGVSIAALAEQYEMETSEVEAIVTNPVQNDKGDND